MKQHVVMCVCVFVCVNVYTVSLLLMLFWMIDKTSTRHYSKLYKINGIRNIIFIQHFHILNNNIIKQSEKRFNNFGNHCNYNVYWSILILNWCTATSC
jgi:hypothetical protein